MTNSVNSDNDIHCWNSQPTEANFCKTRVADSTFKLLKSFITTHNLPVTICARVSCAVWLCWCCLFRFKPHLSKVDWSLEFWYYGTCYTNARTTHVYTHARMHTHTHAHTRTCTYTHAHTHTRMHHLPFWALVDFTGLHIEHPGQTGATQINIQQTNLSKRNHITPSTNNMSAITGYA